MNAYLDTTDSLVGKLAFAIDDEGALLGLKFADGRYPLTIEEELERDGFDLRRYASEEAAADGPTARLRKEISEYFAGDRWVFDVPLVLRGSEFQKAVWKELSRIPFGETRTYAEVSRTVGRPKSARAVGRANATNRIPLVIPCHRAIGADGTLTGFGGGIHIKERLLEHERRVLTSKDHPAKGRALKCQHNEVANVGGPRWR